MPSGKTHNRINQSILITFILIAIFYPQTPMNLWWLILGLAIGVNYLGPDLDKNNTRQDQNWGVYGVYWNIYAKLMPHRGASHSLIGVASRLLFLLPLMILLFVLSRATTWQNNNGDLISLFFESLKYFLKLHIEQVGFVIFGIVIADGLHIGEDIFLRGVK